MVDTVESGLKTHFATKPLLPCQLIRDREVQMNNGKSDSINAHSVSLSTNVSFIVLFLFGRQVPTSCTVLTMMFTPRTASKRTYNSA